MNILAHDPVIAREKTIPASDPDPNQRSAFPREDPATQMECDFLRFYPMGCLNVQKGFDHLI